MVLDGLGGVKRIGDGLGSVPVIDDHPSVEGYVVLVAHQCDVVDDDVIMSSQFLDLLRRLDEGATESVRVLVHLDMYNPAVILLLQPHEEGNH